MSVFVGLDVALNSVSICIVDEAGTPVWQGKSLSEPAPLIAALLLHRENITQVGIEACPLSEWLYGALRDAGFPVVCIETRHTQRFLSSRPNKTDRSDARGIAEMMRLGHFRAVHVKSGTSQRIRTVLAARSRLVQQIIKIENTIRGLLKVYGLKVGSVHRCTFAARIEALLERAPDLRLGIDPLLEVRNVMRRQKVLLDRKLSLAARGDETCRRLMTIPGVGPIVSLAFKATIDDPSRFKNAKSVAAHLGLTPRIYQSGEIERIGNISKCGDAYASLAIRSRQLASADRQEIIGFEGLGDDIAAADRRQEDLRSCSAAVGDHHASHVGRPNRLQRRANRVDRGIDASPRRCTSRTWARSVRFDPWAARRAYVLPSSRVQLGRPISPDPIMERHA